MAIQKRRCRGSVARATARKLVATKALHIQVAPRPYPGPLPFSNLVWI